MVIFWSIKKMDSFIVASTGEWNLKYFDQFSKEQKGEWSFASTITELDKLLEVVNPRYIFFPHWSWVVPEEIVKRHECVCFHMTDLPYGKGGSPLQNLIIQGCDKTMLTALRMEKGIDTGPIYYKKPLSLHGSAHDIYKRAGRLCWDMISDFIKENPNPVLQQGTTTNFKRRTPEQSRIPEGLSLKGMYNYIRMLDAPGYPKAFLEMNDYRLEFWSSDYVDGRLSAKVSFIKREDNV
jgi:methionyl-tRNA formyltransferase